MTAIPRAIRLKLDEVRETLRSYLWWRSLLMIGFWALLIFWLAAAIDFLPVRVGASESSRTVRAVFLILLACGIGWILLGWMLPRWIARIRDSSLALLIEKHYPSFSNELVTAIELSNREAEVADPVAHQAMLERVFARAETNISEVTVHSLFNWRPIQKLCLLTIIGLLATGLVAAMQWDWFSHWSKRFWALSDQPWPRQAILKADFLQIQIPPFTGQLVAEQKQIQFKDALVRVPKGASLLLQVSADASAKRVPDACTLYYQTEDAIRGRANMRRIGSPVDGWQQFHLDGPPLDGVNSDLLLDVVGLDARIRKLRVDVVERIVVTEMNLNCQYPKYLMDSLSVRAETELVPYRAGLKIQEGTICSLVGKCNSPLDEVQFVSHRMGNDQSEETLEIQMARIEDDQFEIPLGALSESQLIEIRLTDQFGLSSEQVLRYHLNVTQDLVPEVKSRLEGIGLAITPRAYLPFRGSVTDDYAVAAVFADVAVDQATIPSVPLQLDDDVLSGDVDFSRLADAGVVSLQPGMTIGLTVVAQDYYNLAQESHEGRGQPAQLAVVNEDQLLVLLDRSELELRQRLEQIIAELTQVKELLQTLSRSLAETLIPASGPPGDQIPATSSGASYQPNLQESENGAPAPSSDYQTVLRLAILRAQQSQLQTDKSRQELSGIVNRIEHLRLQLVHNRIDSLDRQQRLLEQVQVPMTSLLDREYVELEKLVAQLQSATMSGRGKSQAESAVDALDGILRVLESIKSSMMDIESFNELVDLVRGMLDEQERVLKETQETQRARILDLLK